MLFTESQTKHIYHISLSSHLPLGCEWSFYSCSIFHCASKPTQPFHHVLGLLNPWGFTLGQSSMCSLSDVSIHRFMPDLFTKGFHHRSNGSIKVSMTLNMIHGHWLVNTHQSLHVLHDHWMINMFYSFMILQSLDNTCLHHITNKVTIRPSYLDTINDPSMTHQWFLVNDTSMTLHNSINSLHDSIHFVFINVSSFNNLP